MIGPSAGQQGANSCQVLQKLGSSHTSQNVCSGIDVAQCSVALQVPAVGAACTLTAKQQAAIVRAEILSYCLVIA